MKPFVYHPIGQLALVGRRSGVAQLYGIQLSGVVAWAMWRGIYLAKLPQVAKRVRVGLDWLLDAVAGRELAALPGMVSETGRSNTLASESVPTRSQETKTKAKSSP
jgi:NADH dehydrogenase